MFVDEHEGLQVLLRVTAPVLRQRVDRARSLVSLTPRILGGVIDPQRLAQLLLSEHGPRSGPPVGRGTEQHVSIGNQRRSDFPSTPSRTLAAYAGLISTMQQVCPPTRTQSGDATDPRRRDRGQRSAGACALKFCPSPGVLVHDQWAPGPQRSAPPRAADAPARAFHPAIGR